MTPVWGWWGGSGAGRVGLFVVAHLVLLPLAVAAFLGGLLLIVTGRFLRFMWGDRW